MARKFIDCREFPSETICTVAISADSESELLEVAVQHAVAMIRNAIKDGMPSADAPRRVA